jgi:hypothetical protein
MGVRDKIKAERAEQEQRARDKPQSAPRTSYISTSNGAGPFDKLDDLATWADILGGPAPNWVKVKPSDAETLEAWQHPNATHPISAKVLKANPHVLVVWSTNCGLPAGAEQDLTKARVYAHLWHNGDESAAAKAMLRGEATYLPAHIQDALKSAPFDPLGLGGPFGRPSADQGQRQDRGGTEEGTKEESKAPSSWRPVDLTSVLDGTWKPPTPTVGQRTDGKGLFYPGKTHTVVSETEAGKTWVGLAASIHEMAAGCHVFFIDFEDDQGSVVGRLLNLGVDPEAIHQLFHYFRPEHPLAGVHLAALCEELASYGPSLAMIDGITEAMELHGLNPIDNTDIAKFNRMVSSPLAASGAAQVSFDHVVKNREGRGRYALGGVHKLNIVSGAGYTLENRQPFGIGVTGRSTLKIAKDRPGQLRCNAVDKWYGDLVLASNADGTAEVSIESPQERVAERESEQFRPTNLMEKVSRYLEEEDGPRSQNQILGDVKGKRDYKILALKLLREEGYVTKTTPHESIKPYREGNEDDHEES